MVGQEIIIENKEQFEKLKKKIQEGGAENMHILADFDRTFTKAFVNGKKVSSIVAILRNEGYLTEDYPKKAHDLFDKYHPIEIDPSIPHKEKEEKMLEWWSKHIDLLIESGLNKKDIKNAMASGTIVFREDVEDFLKMTHKHKIPVIIISASGIGDAVPILLEKKGLLFDNIHVVSNFLDFDENGNAVKLKGQIIHVMNKSEASIENLPIHVDLIKRKNVLLLGDSLGDPEMIEGFDFDNLVKIGFVNYEEEKNAIEEYKRKYNALIINDGSFEFINNLLRDILK